MASVTHSDIQVERTPVQIVDRRPSGRRESPNVSDQQSSLGVSITQYHPSFSKIIGPEPTHSLLLSSADTSRNPFFHSACVYLPEHEELYTTSNLLQSSSSAQLPIILISKIKLRRDESRGGAVSQVEWAKLRPPPNMAMPASGTPYKKGILFCAQGNLTPGSSGLYYMPRGKPPQAVVTDYYGRDFNSVHDVVVAGDGSFWFTDPWHGFEMDFRKRPQMPGQVYRCDAVTGDVRVVADGLGRPTGVCFGAGERTLYVTDTDAVHADGNQDSTRAATIYAFDVVERGIKCDGEGNVYASCADGVEVWNGAGSLLGVIEIQGGVTSFCFARDGEMFVCSEQRLWRVHLQPASQRGGSTSPPTGHEDNFI